LATDSLSAANDCVSRSALLMNAS